MEYPKSKIWKERSNSEIDKEILEELDIKEPIATILANRNITKKEDIINFVNPSIDKLHNPYLLQDMDVAVDRIVESIDNKEPIMIYGDYDVDGITSTSIIYMFLKELGAEVDYYIPDRIEEGYGLNNNALQTIYDNGTKLLITVDTGIAANEECRFANDIGLDIIITDHHECQEKLPGALAVIDPKREDCQYPFDMLAGVGVTFKLIQALAIKLNIPLDEILKYLDIVAIGTVADIVPLIDENRIITKLAFETIPDTWNIGLKELLEVSEIKDDQKITAGIIGFRVAPRLNASGRMGDAKRGVNLFVTKDKLLAKSVAEELNEENLKRQEMEENIYNEAIDIIEKTEGIENDKIIVVASEQWHHGVIGIVSSRITEKYYKPSIILTIEDGVASGSARSVEGFSIFDALYESRGLMKKFGGHDMAAGMSLAQEDVPTLRKQLNEYATKNMDDNTLVPKLKVDTKIDIDNVETHMINEINKLEPYGMGNPEPTFIVKGSVIDTRVVGKMNNHLKLAIEQSGNKLDGIGFGMSDYNSFFIKDTDVQVLCTLNNNEWNGKITPQMMVKDIKFDIDNINRIEDGYNLFKQVKKEGYKSLENTNNVFLSKREKYEQIYRKLNYFFRNNKCVITIFDLLDKEIVNEKIILNILLVLEVFVEIKILEYDFNNPYITFDLKKGKKVQLSESKVYNVVGN